MKHLILSTVTASICACTAYAGDAKVTWQEPDKYTDICEGNETRDAFRQTLFRDFEMLFTDLAKLLPDGYLFDVTVTDVDLAGEVNLMHSFTWHDIRVGGYRHPVQPVKQRHQRLGQSLRQRPQARPQASS